MRPVEESVLVAWNHDVLGPAEFPCALLRDQNRRSPLRAGGERIP